MPEFVVVTFPARRSVFMDNQPMGQTGDHLTIQAGFHDFDLGSPADYTPATQNVNVVNTTAQNPTIVPFAPLGAKRKARAAKKPAKKTFGKTAKKAKKIAPKKKTAGKTAATKRRPKKKVAKKK